MARFRKKPEKPEVIEATQWSKNGDHPEDQCEMVRPDPKSETQFEPFLSEGKVIRRFRESDEDYGRTHCSLCGGKLQDHGCLDTADGWIEVCPGNWIITRRGERSILTQRLFEMEYQLVED